MSFHVLFCLVVGFFDLGLSGYFSGDRCWDIFDAVFNFVSRIVACDLMEPLFIGTPEVRTKLFAEKGSVVSWRQSFVCIVSYRQ